MEAVTPSKRMSGRGFGLLPEEPGVQEPVAHEVLTIDSPTSRECNSALVKGEAQSN
jgi:hypothetical protein